MRVLKYGALAASFGLVLGLLTLAGCSGSTSTSPPSADNDKDKDKDSGGEKKKGITGGTAVIAGNVKYSGDMPDTSLPKSAKESLEKKPDEKKHCEAAKTDYEKGDPLWKINDKNKGVQYAVVFLKPEGNTFFEVAEIDEAYKAQLAKKTELHQPFCAFIPNSIVVFGKYRDKEFKYKDTNQFLSIYNDTDKAGVDKGIPHNSKVSKGSDEKANLSLTPGGAPLEVKGLAPSLTEPYAVGCSIHPWMSANLWVLDHPYFDVTDEDGNFKIKHAPVGKVRLVVWHAGAGFITNKDGEVIETTKDGETKKEFTVTSKK